jgi:O-glycosyl hydrolase
MKNDRLIAVFAGLILSSGIASSSYAQTINWTNVQQEIDGFGASCGFLTTNLTAAQADMFFSVTNGIGLSLCRNRILPDGTVNPYELSIMQQAQARGAKVWRQPAPGYTGLQASGGMITCTNGAQNNATFYRARVLLQ